MNISGNVRYKSTEEAIEKAVFKLLKRRKYDDFSVKDICLEAGINRSSFYAHYYDINDLMIKIEGKLAKKIEEIWNLDNFLDHDLFITFFSFIKENKVFYKAFLKSQSSSFVVSKMLKKQREQFKKVLYNKNISYSDVEIEYHLYFFGGGLKAICGLWLQNDCKESPEEMAKIIYNEYLNNAKYFD